MVQTRRQLDVLSILPRREDERRFGELPFAQPAAFCVLPAGKALSLSRIHLSIPVFVPAQGQSFGQAQPLAESLFQVLCDHQLRVVATARGKVCHRFTEFVQRVVRQAGYPAGA